LRRFCTLTLKLILGFVIVGGAIGPEAAAPSIKPGCELILEIKDWIVAAGSPAAIADCMS
jgi:hypothetical protein